MFGERLQFFEVAPLLDPKVHTSRIDRSSAVSHSFWIAHTHSTSPADTRQHLGMVNFQYWFIMKHPLWKTLSGRVSIHVWVSGSQQKGGCPRIGRTLILWQKHLNIDTNKDRVHDSEFLNTLSGGTWPESGELYINTQAKCCWRLPDIQPSVVAHESWLNFCFLWLPVGVLTNEETNGVPQAALPGPCKPNVWSLENRSADQSLCTEIKWLMINWSICLFLSALHLSELSEPAYWSSALFVQLSICFQNGFIVSDHNAVKLLMV